MKTVLACMLPLLMVLPSANADKKIVSVIPWGVECGPIATIRGEGSMCIGYDPLPESIFGGRSDVETELEPLYDKPDIATIDAVAGEGPKVPESASNQLLDDVRAGREQYISDQLVFPAPNTFGGAGTSYKEYFDKLVQYSDVVIFSGHMDFLASPKCGANNEPCLPCEELSLLEHDTALFDPRKILVAQGNSVSLEKMLLRIKARNEWPKNTQDSLDILRITWNAMSTINSIENVGMKNQQEISRSVNRELNRCVQISIEKALDLFERNLSGMHSVTSKTHVIKEDPNLASRIAQLYMAVAPGYAASLKDAGLIAREEEQIPLSSDKFDNIAKKVNASSATNPQARNAKGLIKALIKIGRALDMDGAPVQSEACLVLATSITNIGIGLLPVVGIGKDVYEASIGVSLIDGSQLSLSDRGFAVFGVMTFGLGDEILKAVQKLIDTAAGKTVGKLVIKHYENIVAMVSHKNDALQTVHSTTPSLPTMENLRNYLGKQEYSSMVDDVGRLRPESISKIEVISEEIKSDIWREILVRDGSQLADWRYSKYVMDNAAGYFQGRLYQNIRTGEYHLVKTHIDQVKLPHIPAVTD